MATLTEHTYRYPFLSHVRDDSLAFAATKAITAPDDPAAPGAFAHSPFLAARLSNPRPTTVLLHALSHVVRTHFFDARPPQMDPIVTVSRSHVRWEGFSGCCGAYVRLDLLDDAMDSEHRGFGTTNVDFNTQMLQHLAGVGASENVSLEIASDSVSVTREVGAVIERKVTLPRRWLKGLCEVQVCQSRLAPLHHLRPAALAPLLQVTGKSAAGASFLSFNGPRPRVSTRKAPGSIAVGGLSRISALRSLLPLAKEIVLYADDAAANGESGVHAWMVDLGWAKFWLVLSPALQRGFSGEGQALDALADGWQDNVDELQSLLEAPFAEEQGPMETIDPAELAARLGGATADVEASLAAMAACGLAGFDAASGYYFQRHLPFAENLVERDQPRLKAARKLVEQAAVTIVATEPRLEAQVRSGDVHYWVRIENGQEKCTCPWHSRYQGDRGPCKHVLAVRLTLASDSTS